MASPLESHALLAGSLAVLGLLWVLKTAASLAAFCYLYVRPSALPRYLHAVPAGGGPAWALVTGATHGIGRGFAAELATRGFNVLLHGRSAAKLATAEAELRAAFPDRDFATLRFDITAELRRGGAADVQKRLGELAEDVDRLTGRGLTVLVNNAGGGPQDPYPLFGALDSYSVAAILATVDLNAVFPALLSSVLAPQLRRNAPGLIVNLGSLADNGLPLLAAYGASKSFLATLSRAMSLEFVIDHHNAERQAVAGGAARPWDVEVLAVRVGSATKKVEHTSAWAAEPDCRTMARTALARVGCGRSVITAHLPHALQQASVDILPESVAKVMFVETMKSLYKDMVAEKKAA